MNIHEICNGIYYVGVNDRTTHRFEGMWPLPQGVSYNSYIVKGADKVALIDTVHIAQSSKFLNKIEEITGGAAIDYLVINHMEPDHSGSIQAIKLKYPNMKIVGNSKTVAMLGGYYGISSDDVVVVADNDVIDLGGKTLKFVLTPMVHWPETMMTYVEEDGVLFSGDAFGCFGALNGGVVDTQFDTTAYYPEMYRYYSNIVAKYGMFVQKAIARFDGVCINYVCSTHGPVWHDEIARVVDAYSRMARFEGEPGVVVAYASMYGNTEELAERVSMELSRNGVRNVKVYNLSTTHVSFVLADIMRYNGLIIGGPTYNNGLFPEVERLLSALKGREFKNRYVGCFGSGSWAPVSSKCIKACVESMKVELVGEPFDMKCSETGEDVERCRALAAALAAKVNG